jgi:SAM-dependent methyltransferase
MPRKPPPARKGIRPLYDELGAQAYYEQHGAAYRNPHEAIVARAIQSAVTRWKLDTTRVLDLACGSGEATLALAAAGVQSVVGVDPYTWQAYEARTGRAALRHTFEDIALGALAEQRFSLVVCSFALHLLADSWLPPLCHQLAVIAPALLIITPHKRPALAEAWGWRLHAEDIAERVRARLYLRISGSEQGAAAAHFPA